MVDKMAALDENEAWYLEELSNGRNIVGNKWVFKKKMNGEGKVEKYKARLVAKVIPGLRELNLVRFFLLLPS
jgi:hypothetical protein